MSARFFRSLLMISLLALSPFSLAQDAVPKNTAQKASGEPAATETQPSGAILHTNQGEIEITFFPEKAPVTVANFVEYARTGFYDGTIFHRVIPNFVIQGGGFTPAMKKKQTRDPIVNESDNGLNNDRWTLSMARTQDPDSATSQFFINLRTNASLDPVGKRAGYAVFAEVVDGRSTVKDIAKVPTQSVGPYADVPVTPVVIESIELKP